MDNLLEEMWHEMFWNYRNSLLALWAIDVDMDLDAMLARLLAERMRQWALRN